MEKRRNETPAERAERERRNAIFLAKRGNFDAIRQLSLPCVDVRDEQGYSVFHWAALLGDLDAAKWLLESHADPDAKATNLHTPLFMACQRGNIDIVLLLLGGRIPLADVAESGRFKAERSC